MRQVAAQSVEVPMCFTNLHVVGKHALSTTPKQAWPAEKHRTLPTEERHTHKAVVGGWDEPRQHPRVPSGFQSHEHTLRPAAVVEVEVGPRERRKHAARIQVLPRRTELQHRRQ